MKILSRTGLRIEPFLNVVSMDFLTCHYSFGWDYLPTYIHLKWIITIIIIIADICWAVSLSRYFSKQFVYELIYSSYYLYEDLLLFPHFTNGKAESQVVKHCEVSEISPYLYADRLASHWFVDDYRRQKTSRSETKDCIAPGTAAAWASCVFWFLVPQAHRGSTGWLKSTLHTVYHT